MCALYGHSTCNGNELRYVQFCSQKSSASHLPPTKNSLCKHVLRSNHQAAIWRRALEGLPTVPSPHQQGWLITDGGITIDWTDQRPAPDELLELTHCGCKTGCGTMRCSCKKALMKCTDACSCKDCSNKKPCSGDSDSEPDNLLDDVEDSDDCGEDV